MVKKLFSIDPNVKGAMSEMFDKSQMSETIDVPAGWGSVHPPVNRQTSFTGNKNSNGFHSNFRSLSVIDLRLT